jgi:hypothetical protein
MIALRLAQTESKTAAAIKKYSGPIASESFLKNMNNFCIRQTHVDGARRRITKSL